MNTQYNDPKGQAGSLKAPLGLVPPIAMEKIALAHKLGADKYGEMKTTFTLQRKLVSENPRVVDYRFSDRPDEIFTDYKLLQKHRGLTDEQLQQTITIYEPQ